MTATRTLSLTDARRLAITKQRLSEPTPPNTKDGILETVRSIGCLQLDPISAVARNHLLVLWSRIGSYDVKDLDALLGQDRKLFEYWAHAASIVLTEDFPLFDWTMQKYRGFSTAEGDETGWMSQNLEFRDYILGELRARGPMQSKDFEDTSRSGWTSSGWTNGRNVNRMLDNLWFRGAVLISSRKGGQRLWDLAERVLPDWTPRQQLSDREATYIAAQRSLRMLGVGTQNHIKYNYIRHRYPHLPEVLKQLEKEELIEKVQVQAEDGGTLVGTWYIHRDDVPVLESIQAGEWRPRTTLLSPFDNLIADRNRTEQLFDYKFRIEIYVPKHLRQYGYYVLSILHGDRIIGRIDPLMERKVKRLNIRAVHAEPDAPMTADAGQAIAGSIQELASFLGATEIAYSEQVPEGWRDAMVSGEVSSPANVAQEEADRVYA